MIDYYYTACMCISTKTSYQEEFTVTTLQIYYVLICLAMQRPYFCVRERSTVTALPVSFEEQSCRGKKKPNKTSNILAYKIMVLMVVDHCLFSRIFDLKVQYQPKLQNARRTWTRIVIIIFTHVSSHF